MVSLITKPNDIFKKQKPLWLPNPSCITSVMMKDGAYREIDNFHGNDQYPERLKRFERKIDKIIGIKDYIGKG